MAIYDKFSSRVTLTIWTITWGFYWAAAVVAICPVSLHMVAIAVCLGGTPMRVTVFICAVVIGLSLISEGEHTVSISFPCSWSSLASHCALFFIATVAPVPLHIMKPVCLCGTPQSIPVFVGAGRVGHLLVYEREHAAGIRHRAWCSDARWFITLKTRLNVWFTHTWGGVDGSWEDAGSTSFVSRNFATGQTRAADIYILSAGFSFQFAFWTQLIRCCWKKGISSNEIIGLVWNPLINFFSLFIIFHAFDYSFIC